MNLTDFATNVNSQTGEDGIIKKILSVIPNGPKWAVEFGAWDGKYLSNTCSLVENEDFNAIFIEADMARYLELKKHYSNNRKVICLNAFVGFNQKDNLDYVLRDTEVPPDFTVLSIDIDGNDYHVWKAACRLRPKVVCIEYNPTIATGVKFVQPMDPKINWGSSISSITDLGKEKGYQLVAVTPLNAIFVREDFYSLFGIAENTPEKLRNDTSCVTHIFNGYDGQILLSGLGFLPQHGVSIKSRIRQIPRYFRSYPENFSPFKRSLFRLYRKICNYQSLH